MRTLLELLLLTNPKVSPLQLAVLLPQIYNILTPLTNLSCSACSLALQSYNEQSHSMMVANLSIVVANFTSSLIIYVVKVTALDVLKIIISTNKVQIGPHISSDVVHLLFTIAEMGAERQLPLLREDSARAFSHAHLRYSVSGEECAEVCAF